MREGVGNAIAVYLKREGAPGGVEGMPAFDFFELRAIEHARDAVKGGVA